MSEKKLVFVSIASPNNLTPTSEKQACTLLWRVPYYGLNAWKTVEADMSGSIGAHYYKRSKMMLGNQSKPYQTNFEIDRLEVKKGISVRSQEWNLNVVADDGVTTVFSFA
ncbi:hypothetical protein HID58_022068 [Brassica napus]|uniref:Uncharacterized protein n=1 Tax=Brassica napus TaxID=3708 RepID=A0ABQ8CY58_BRANA|nr:hypothetical protein HID58_022068 [Brassica napus]